MASIAIDELRPKPSVLRVQHPVNGGYLYKVPVVSTDDAGADVTIYNDCEFHLEVVSVFSAEFYTAAIKYLEDLQAPQDEMTSLNVISEAVAKTYAACVIGWKDNGVLTDPYTPEGAEQLLTNPENKWILDQLIKYVVEKVHFFGKPSTNT